MAAQPFHCFRGCVGQLHERGDGGTDCRNGPDCSKASLSARGWRRNGGMIWIAKWHFRRRGDGGVQKYLLREGSHASPWAQGGGHGNLRCERRRDGSTLRAWMASAMPQSDSAGSPAWRGWRHFASGKHLPSRGISVGRGWRACEMVRLPEEDGIYVGAWDGGYAYSR